MATGSAGESWSLLTLGELNARISEDPWLAHASDASSMRDDSISIDWLRRLLASGASDEYADEAAYLLGFLLGSSDSVQFDPAGSRRMFQLLVDEHPDSPLAGDAHLRLGQYAIEEGDPGEAIAQFQQVVDLGPAQRHLNQGLYMLAWSRYRATITPDDYRLSMSLFADLLDRSAEERRRTGQPDLLEPEAIQYLAIECMELADVIPRTWDSATGAAPPTPLDLAEEFFHARGAPPYEPDVIEQLAEWQTRLARLDDAISTHLYFQARWPLAPRDPSHQRAVAELNMQLNPQRPDAALDALLTLTRQYGASSAWAEANRGDPAALETASRLVAEALVSAATWLHRQADQPTPETDRQQVTDEYRHVVELYREYLARYPQARDAHEIQSYLATVLQTTGELDQAADLWSALLQSGDPAYHDMALWQLMQARRGLLMESAGSVDERPPGASIERQVALPGGRTRTVYALSPAHQRLLEVADALVCSTPTDPDYKAAVEKFRPALAYLSANMLFNHGHYEEARPRFERIITDWPRSDEAAYSAALMVRSYRDDGDAEKAEELTRQYLELQLGADRLCCPK